MSHPSFPLTNELRFEHLSLPYVHPSSNYSNFHLCHRKQRLQPSHFSSSNVMYRSLMMDESRWNASSRSDTESQASVESESNSESRSQPEPENGTMPQRDVVSTFSRFRIDLLRMQILPRLLDFQQEDEDPDPAKRDNDGNPRAYIIYVDSESPIKPVLEKKRKSGPDKLATKARPSPSSPRPTAQLCSTSLATMLSSMLATPYAQVRRPTPVIPPRTPSAPSTGYLRAPKSSVKYVDKS